MPFSSSRRFAAVLVTAVTSASALLVASPVPADAATAQITISGTVACRGGHEVVGVWVASSGGGSKWASYTKRSYAPWVAEYTATFTTSTPTKIRIDTGCGRTSTGAWYSNNASPTYSTSSSKKINLVCKEAAGTAQRCAGWPDQLLVGMPFPGKYGKESPSTHHSSGDWSIDLYAIPGTAVRVKVVNSASVPLKMVVNNVRTTCGTAGRSVRIDLYRNNVKLGWIDYGHLANVPTTVKAGATVAQNQQIGVTHKWASQADNCWVVSSNSGVHTHFTAYDYDAHANVADYACWANYTMGSSLAAGRWIGSVGLTNATRKKQACT